MALLLRPETGDLWIDVGQDRWEEVDFVAAGTEWPLNFGWDVYEGDEQVEDGELQEKGDLVGPVAVYAHDLGCSITGGFVYRGADLPAMRGRYLYGDYCSGMIARPAPRGRRGRRRAPGGGLGATAHVVRRGRRRRAVPRHRSAARSTLAAVIG